MASSLIMAFMYGVCLLCRSSSHRKHRSNKLQSATMSISFLFWTSPLAKLPVLLLQLNTFNCDTFLRRLCVRSVEKLKLREDMKEQEKELCH